MQDKIRRLIKQGYTCQHELFQMLYPTYNGHYARLRDEISEVKNAGVA